jgi:hypothetical protein
MPQVESGREGHQRLDAPQEEVAGRKEPSYSEATTERFDRSSR